MNLRGRYDMLRQAILLMVGLPNGSLDDLKEMASVLQVQAMVDADAAVSLLVLQTLIVTHDNNHVSHPFFDVTVVDDGWTGPYHEWLKRGARS